MKNILVDISELTLATSKFQFFPDRSYVTIVIILFVNVKPMFTLDRLEKIRHLAA